MLDRFVRHVGRRRFYPRLAPLLWREPKSFSHTPQRLRPALSNAARPEPAEREWFLGRFPEVARCVIQAAERVSQHVFDFLGTGSVDWGDSIDWHQDVQIGYRWPLKFYSQVSSTASNAIAADPKIPWELSRLHHFVTLGQAYWLTDDRRWSDEFFAQWESWLASNPCPYGINWTSAMDVAIRVVNLMWGCALVADAPGWTGEQDAYLNHSLRQHGLYIEHNLEIGVWDGQVVTASHYLANIVGLLCLGLLCSELPEAARWRRAGLRALMVEIERQILPDGANYEASTSYHRLAVEFFTIAALLCRRCGVELPRRFWERLERAYEYILYCTQPDGQVPAIGDGDDGRLLILSGYPVWERNDHRYLLAIGAVLFERADFRAAVGDCPADLLWLLGREGVESFDALPLTATSVSSRAFPEVGVYVIRHDNDHALLRIGKVGTDGLGGHTHNDALSLVLSLGGKPLLVDPGTYVYTSDVAARDRFRGTRAHNTICVDEEEINRFRLGDPFALMYDATPEVLVWQVDDSSVEWCARHDGYARLPSPVIHQRTVRYDRRQRVWIVEDWLQAEGKHHIEWWLHFAPGLQVRIEKGKDDLAIHADHAEMNVAVRGMNEWKAEIRADWVSPSYGVRVPAEALCLEGQCQRGCRIQARIRRVRRPVIEVEKTRE